MQVRALALVIYPHFIAALILSPAHVHGLVQVPNEMHNELQGLYLILPRCRGTVQGLLSGGESLINVGGCHFRHCLVKGLSV